VQQQKPQETESALALEPRNDDLPAFRIRGDQWIHEG